MESVDTSISDLVTIIIKAPNQQIADQSIQCHLNWTIKKLKDYLSEVYPSKPKMEEQKLIYSGKLLTDSAVLKDILRTYDGQENHTVHLVCTTKSQKLNKIFNPISTGSIRGDGTQNNANTTDTFRENSQGRNQQNTIPNSSSIPVTAPHSPFFDQFNSNQFMTNNFDPRYFWPSAAAFVNVNDVDANQQFAYMQQAYAQYISQYMQMIGQPGLGYMTSPVSQPIRTSHPMTIPNNNLLQERNQAADNRPAVGAVGNNMDEEEGRNNRDWLDWFYVFSRIVVLFSVVYFYSTPLRMLAVILLVGMFYLHQNMRPQNDQLNVNLNNNNNNNNVVNHNNQNDDNPAVVENRNNEGLHRRTSLETSTPANTDEPVAPPVVAQSTQPTSIRSESATPPAPVRLSPVAITLLAIRTFFLSLVPDRTLL